MAPSSLFKLWHRFPVLALPLAATLAPPGATAARRLDGGDFEATLDLGAPPGSFNWSIALRDDSTDLISFVLTTPGR